MNARRLSTFATLTLVTVAAGCGGRTRGKHDAMGELVTVDAGSGSPEANATTPGLTVTPPPSPTPVAPTNGFPTTTPVVTSATDVPMTDVPTLEPGVPMTVVSPPQATGCPVPDFANQPTVGYTYSDGVTTIDLASGLGSSEWCAYGSAGPAGSDYANWGAGMGGFVAYQTESGVTLPFDASALGIVGIRFLLDVQGSPVRLMLTEVNSPDVPAGMPNYEDNAFVWGGSTPYEMNYSGSYEVRFEDIELPYWTTLPEEFQRPFDASRVHSFQFMITNTANDDFRDYGFCMTNVEWVDACGNSVVLNTASETSAVIPDPIPDPTTSAPDSTFPGFDSTSSPDVASLAPVSSAPLQTSEVPSAVDAGAADTRVDESIVADASVQ